MTKSSSASRNRFSPPSNFVNQVNARNDCELCDSTTNVVLVIIFIIISHHALQCFDAVGWVAGRASGL